MLKVRDTTKNPQHKQRISTSIQTAVETVHHFEKRVADPEVRKELTRDLNRLERAIQG